MMDEWRPSLDFALRFQTGYIVRCPLDQFGGKKSTVITYLRIMPRGKEPRLFGAFHRVPEMTPQMLAEINPRNLKQQIGMSGVVGVGEGDYSADLLVTDDRHRSCRKHWKMHVSPNRSQRDVHLDIQPLTVESLDRQAWKISPVSDPRGLRLTIFLDAAPMNPFQSRLRAWDRAFLLECIYSLLRQTPYQSVRVIAFNLEQQLEIFRRDQFDDEGFPALSRALQQIETASISVQALQKRKSPEFLLALANQELAADHSSDAVIFLGPNGHTDIKPRDELLAARKPGSPPFFYFEYFPSLGSEFPDGIQRLTKALEGRTFQIHSPAELDQAIQKMLAQLKQE